MIAILLWAGALVAGIATAGSARQLRRVDYGWRAARLVVVGLLFAFGIRNLGLPGHLDLSIVAPMFVLVLILAFFGARWSVHRLNHMGWSRWWALLLLLPAANLITLIGLCIVRGQTDAASLDDPTE